MFNFSKFKFVLFFTGLALFTPNHLIGYDEVSEYFSGHRFNRCESSIVAQASQQARLQKEQAKFRKAVCWRFHPERIGCFQLLNAAGKVTYSHQKQIGDPRRSLVSGLLEIESAGETFSFPRHPEDKQHIIANGFSPCFNIISYTGPSVPFSYDEVNLDSSLDGVNSEDVSPIKSLAGIAPSTIWGEPLNPITDKPSFLVPELTLPAISLMSSEDSDPLPGPYGSIFDCYRFEAPQSSSSFSDESSVAEISPNSEVPVGQYISSSSEDTGSSSQEFESVESFSSEISSNNCPSSSEEQLFVPSVFRGKKPRMDQSGYKGETSESEPSDFSKSLSSSFSSEDAYLVDSVIRSKSPVSGQSAACDMISENNSFPDNFIESPLEVNDNAAIEVSRESQSSSEDEFVPVVRKKKNAEKENSVSLTNPEITTVMQSVGKKRSKKTRVTEQPSLQKVKRTDVNFKAVVCWRIDPKNQAYFQLLDQNNKVLYSEKVETHCGKRKLEKGRLRIMERPRCPHRFRRHISDKANLIRSGFDKEFLKKVLVYDPKDQSITDLSSIDFTKAVCWRAAPGNLGYYQLLDKKGEVLCLRKVETDAGARRLSDGYLRLYDRAEVAYRFRRHIDDKEDLEKCGFDKKSLNEIRTYNPYPSAAKPSKYEGIDFTKVVSWRIHPDSPGYFQLLGAKNKVTHSEKVQTKKGERCLNDGYLGITESKKSTHLIKRHIDDKENLERHGFNKKSLKNIRIYDPAVASLIDISSVDFTKVVCWRVNPNKDGYYQLLDSLGCAVYSSSIKMIAGNKRSLSNGYLDVKKGAKHNLLRRHPDDEAVLEEHDFKPGSKAVVYNKSKVPWIVAGVDKNDNLDSSDDLVEESSEKADEYADSSSSSEGEFVPVFRKRPKSKKADPVPATNPEITSVIKSVGKKRSKKTRNIEKPAPKKQKHEAIGFQHVVCWRVDPDKSGFFQLLDKQGRALCSRPVLVKGRQRCLSKGWLVVGGRRDRKLFKRHSEDKEKLEDHGFSKKSLSHIKVYDPECVYSIDYSEDDLKKAVCWRIDPDKPGFFQLLDKQGRALFSRPVLAKGKQRYLKKGWLLVYGRNNVQKTFKRHIDDKEKLEDHGFSKKSLSHIKIYDPECVYSIDYSEDDLKKAVCWRIDPDHPGYFQLLDKKMNVLCSQRVRTEFGLRSLDRRSLSATVRRSKHAKKYRFPRHINDEEDLSSHGFDTSLIRGITIFDPNTGSEKVDDTVPVCWRVAPKLNGYFELLNQSGEVILTKAVKTKHGKKKKLSSGSLRACINSKSKRFYRHPADNKSLEEHGFVVKSEAKIYEGPEVPWIVADADKNNNFDSSDDSLEAEEGYDFSE